MGVHGAVLASAAPGDADRVRRTARAHGCAWQLGVHPWWAGEGSVRNFLDALATTPLPHGLGECGLDAIRARSDDEREQQLAVLRPQLDIARRRGLAVVFHCVRAWHVLRDELRQRPVPAGAIHGWTGSVEQTREVLREGLHVSVGPDVLRSPRARAAAAAVPLDRLLLESDAPDRPVPGAERGEPAHIVRVAQAIAADRGLAVDELLAITGATARALFAYSSKFATP